MVVTEWHEDNSLNPLCFLTYHKNVFRPCIIGFMDITFKTHTHFKSNLKHELTENAVSGSDQKNAKLDLTEEQKNQLIQKKKKKEEEKKEKKKNSDNKNLIKDEKSVDKKNILFVI